MRIEDCYDAEGMPLKCWHCGSTHHREEIRDVVDFYHGQGPVSEYEVFCATCGTGLAYWAYGSFDPNYVRHQ